tara:strand:+ start:1275 stop:1529 length:255 start_codon:yes stop_codon:yes gene_type:complete
MQEYDNTNKGVAFKNDYKTEDKHPYYKGKGNFKGQDFEFGIWIKENDKGKFLTFAFSEPYKKEGSSAPQPPEDNDTINLSDIPF